MGGRRLLGWVDWASRNATASPWLRLCGPDGGGPKIGTDAALGVIHDALARFFTMGSIPLPHYGAHHQDPEYARGPLCYEGDRDLRL